MCSIHDHRRPGLSWFESSRSGWWSTAALIIASLSPCARAVAVDPPQTQQDQNSSSPLYAEVLPAEPQDSQPTLQKIEQQLRRNAKIHQPYMNRTDFAALCRKLALDEAQLANVSLAFDAYEQRLQKLHEDHMDRVVPVMLEYIRISQEEADGEIGMAGELVVAIGKSIERQRKKNNELLQDLHRAVQVFLREDQLKAHASALRAWRRSFMLNPGENDRRDVILGPHVDVFEVIEQACQREPVLAGLLAREAQPPANAGLDLAQARRECQELLDAFELELDTLIRTRFWRTSQRVLRLQRASAIGDQDTVEGIRRQHLRDWVKIYRFNAKVAERLANSIEVSYGAKLTNEWRAYYYAAYFPRLYEEESSDVLYRWLAQQASIEDDQRQAVDAVYNEHTVSRRVLRFRTRSALIKLVAQFDLSPQMLEINARSGNTPAQITSLDEERDALNRRTIAQFRTILSEDERAAFDAVMARIERDR